MDYKYLLSICYDMARTSPDRSNQNGAIVVNSDGEILSQGRNEFPEKLVVTEDMITDREKKLFNIEHAERNAIFPLVKKGIALEGKILICPWFACDSCARAIALTGISTAIGHKQRMEQTPDRWKASVDAGLKLMSDCGVKLEFYDGIIGCDPIIVNGNPWNP